MANYEDLTVGELLTTNNSELLNSVLFQLQVCFNIIFKNQTDKNDLSRKVRLSSK